jgi:hypothetical protein
LKKRPRCFPSKARFRAFYIEDPCGKRRALIYQVERRVDLQKERGSLAWRGAEISPEAQGGGQKKGRLRRAALKTFMGF